MRKHVSHVAQTRFFHLHIVFALSVNNSIVKSQPSWFQHSCFHDLITATQYLLVYQRQPWRHCREFSTRQQESFLICDQATMRFPIFWNYIGIRSLLGSSTNSACWLTKQWSVTHQGTLLTYWSQPQKSLLSLHSECQLKRTSWFGNQDWKSQNVRFPWLLCVYGISYRQSWNCVDQPHCSSANSKRLFTSSYEVPETFRNNSWIVLCALSQLVEAQYK